MRGVEQIPWVYDAMLATYEALGLRRWRGWLVKGAKGRTLDIGCGTGRNLPLYDDSVQVVGLDPAMDSLRKARQRAPHVPLVRASAHALPFREACFSACAFPAPTAGSSQGTSLSTVLVSGSSARSASARTESGPSS